MLADLREEIELQLDWHKKLLDKVARQAPGRPAVISKATASALAEYLRFRHRFRNLYSTQLEWAEMVGLVMNYPLIHATVVRELEAFLPSTEDHSISGD